MSESLTVGDVATLTRGKTYKGMLVGKPGVALLGLGSIVPGGGFKASGYKTYGGDCPDELTLYPGDIYVSLKGATKDGEMIGSVARVPPEVAKGRLTQDTVCLKFKRSDTDLRDFVYWVLRTPQYRQYCANRATGRETLENQAHPRENTYVSAGADWAHGRQAAWIWRLRTVHRQEAHQAGAIPERDGEGGAVESAT